MRYLPLPLLLLSLLFVACGSTEQMSRRVLKVRAFELNAQALANPVSVHLTTDSVLRVTTYFNMLGDSAMWIDPANNAPVIVPIESVRELVVRDRAKGLLYGMLVGTVAGGATGYAVSLSDEVDRSQKILVGMATGLVVGEIVGYLFGVKTHYVIQ